jgi:hypothetical protein
VRSQRAPKSLAAARLKRKVKTIDISGAGCMNGSRDRVGEKALKIIEEMPDKRSVVAYAEPQNNAKGSSIRMVAYRQNRTER